MVDHTIHKWLQRNYIRISQAAQEIKLKLNDLNGSLLTLKKKCMRSKFSPKLVKKQFKIFSEYNFSDSLDKLKNQKIWEYLLVITV